jgi:hypothetical protein
LLAATTLAVGLTALTLGAAWVAAVEAVAALLVVGLVQALGVRGAERGLWPPALPLAAPAVLGALVLFGLAWIALQPLWPAQPRLALRAVPLPPEQLVPLGAALVLVLSAALAVLTLREPRRPHPEEPSPPRRAAASARSPRGRGRR